MRTLTGLIVLGLAAWMLLALLSNPTAAVPAQAFTSSRQCLDCHADVYAEWESSQHAQSWTNPAVRFLSNDFSNTDCIDCHAPRPIFVTGIGERVLPRSARRVEGVDCISCHALPEVDGEAGGVAGSVTNPAAACRPVQRVELTRADFCAGCHDQHETVTQWRESEWPDLGFDCLDCHMPYRDGDPSAGRAHTFHGGNNQAMLERAVELRAGFEDGSFTVEIENTGTGHSFPTDERSRAADIFWRPLAAEGARPAEWRHMHRMRSPYRHEVDIEDTLLAAHELRRFELDSEDVPAAVEAVEFALFYKRSPYWEDPERPEPEREATLVHKAIGRRP